MKPPVLTKVDFVRRYQAGEFGNASPTWNNPGEFVCSQYAGKVHLRNRVAGGETFYNVPADEAYRLWCNIQHPEQWYCSAMAPTELTIIQGEVQRGLWGLDLWYSRVAKPMRDALRESSRHVGGLPATMILAFSLNDNSWEWLRYLLAEYPDHVVEFSVYGVEWGTVPGHNTVFWEVRKY